VQNDGGLTKAVVRNVVRKGQIWDFFKAKGCRYLSAADLKAEVEGKGERRLEKLSELVMTDIKF
jgi:hypothetical protein